MGFYADHIFPLIDENLDVPELQELRRHALRLVGGRVLEVGFGAARNLPFYPESVGELTAVEPTASSEGRSARKRINRWPGRLTLMAERGESLSFGSDEFDTVVVSYVLCTVTDVAGVLAEIRRVLRPGGRYIFMEHVASADPVILARQNRAARLGFWRRLTCGCEPNRNTELAIREAGFDVVEQEHVVITPARRDPVVRWAYRMCPMIHGSAMNPA